MSPSPTVIAAVAKSGTVGVFGVLAVWTAARAAAAPSHTMPNLGPPIGEALAQAVIAVSLDPLIGPDGSRMLFWSVLTVFLALAVVSAALLTHGPRRSDHQPPGNYPRESRRDPVIVPITHPSIDQTETTPEPRPTGNAHPNWRGHAPQAEPSDHQTPFGTDPTPTEQTSTSVIAETVSPEGLPVDIGRTDGGDTARIDLCAHLGLGLTGPGADGVARRLMASLLDPPLPPTPTTPHLPVVVIPSTELERLLADPTPHAPARGHDHRDLPRPSEHRAADRSTTAQATDAHRHHHNDDRDAVVPPTVNARFYRAPTVGLALTYLEQQLLHRARIDPTPRTPHDHAPVVLIARPDTHQQTRLQSVLAHGARYRITAIVTDNWPPGMTLAVAKDGTTTPTTGPSPTDLRPTIRAFSTSNAQLTTLLHHRVFPRPQTTPLPHQARTAQTSPPGTQPTTSRTSPTSTQSKFGDPDDPDSPRPAPTYTSAPDKPGPPEHPHRSPCKRSGRTPAAPDHGQADARLIIQCFGGMRVDIRTARPQDGQSPDDLDCRQITEQLSPQDVRLLACLAIHPDGIATDMLMEIAWPDIPHSVAGQRLRTALNHLRTTLREAIQTPRAAFATHTHGRYHLGSQPSDASIWVDYAAFTSAARNSRTHDEHQRIEALHHMTSLYIGPLLDQVDLDWPELATIRESTRRSALGAMAQLAEHYETNFPDQAIELLATVLHHDPTVENAATRLINLHLARNDAPAAQHLYTELTDRLAPMGLRPAEALGRQLHFRSMGACQLMCVSPWPSG